MTVKDVNYYSMPLAELQLHMENEFNLNQLSSKFRTIQRIYSRRLK